MTTASAPVKAEPSDTTNPVMLDELVPELADPALTPLAPFGVEKVTEYVPAVIFAKL